MSMLLPLKHKAIRFALALAIGACMGPALSQVAGSGSALEQAQALAEQGRAHEPTDPDEKSEFAGAIAQAAKSGDLFAQAFALSARAEDAERAARQYFRAYVWTWHGNRELDLFSYDDVKAARERAVTWLEKAKGLNVASAWSNYGAMLHFEGDGEAARPAFEKAAAMGVPAAHRYLGRLDEAKAWRGGDFLETALVHYERALALGHAAARADAYRTLAQSMESEDNPDVLESGLARLRKLYLEGEDSKVALERLEQHLQWRRLLTNEVKRKRKVPNLPVFLNVCELEPRPQQPRFGIDVYTVERRYYAQDEWQLDNNGCAKVREPLPGMVHKLLRQGGVVALDFGRTRVPLDWRVDKKAIHLIPRRGQKAE